MPSDLAHRDLGNRTVPATSYNIGDTKNFVTDQEEVTAELVAIGEYIYVWVESALALNPKDVSETVNQFETDYYPRLTQLFGDIWQPGIDNDPRFSILHLASFQNDTEIGYFDSGDEYPISVNNSSNEQEIIYMNMGELDLGSEKLLRYAGSRSTTSHSVAYGWQRNDMAR